MLKHRNEIKEKKYKCMFVNGRIMQLYMVHVILHGTFKCKILLYNMYIIHSNILGARDSTAIARFSPLSFLLNIKRSQRSNYLQSGL